jgi:hypothetical protein
MPDPIQVICSRTPGATYNPRDNSCRWVSESGTEVSIYRNQEGVLVVRGIGRPAASEPAPAPPSSSRSDMENIGISRPAMSRLHEIQSILINHHDSLSTGMIEQLNNELTNLLQALNLGCDIRIVLRLLAKENLDLDTISKMVQRINENLNTQSVSALTAEARAALCLIFNDPNVDLPSIPDDLWNLICN